MIARLLGLPVPEIAFANLDLELARTEPDPEIHALIHDSAGLNLALDYLPGSVSYDRSSTRYSPGWDGDADRARAPFPLIKEHVLLRYATDDVVILALDPTSDLEAMHEQPAMIPCICRPFPVAGIAAQHHHPAVPRAHGADVRSCRMPQLRNELRIKN